MWEIKVSLLFYECHLDVIHPFQACLSSYPYYIGQSANGEFVLSNLGGLLLLGGCPRMPLSNRLVTWKKCRDSRFIPTNQPITELKGWSFILPLLQALSLTLSSSNSSKNLEPSRPIYQARSSKTLETQTAGRIKNLRIILTIVGKFRTWLSSESPLFFKGPTRSVFRGGVSLKKCLQGTNISHLRKRKTIFKSAFGWDTYNIYIISHLSFQGGYLFWAPKKLTEQKSHPKSMEKKNENVTWKMSWPCLKHRQARRMRPLPGNPWRNSFKRGWWKKKSIHQPHLGWRSDYRIIIILSI